MMEHPDNPVAMGPGTLIAHLRQSVQAWIDSDRVLPADGASLLAALGQIQAELAGGDMSRTWETPGAQTWETPGAAARAGITAFVARVQALIAAGLLATDDGQPPIEAAAMIAASLRSASGRDR